MDEKHYHRLADMTLTECFDKLDAAYENGALEELELEGGILTITTPTRRTYVISKHAPTRQIWYASPTLGGLHFSYHDATNSWKLADGRELASTVAGDLKGESVEVAL